MPTEAVFPTYPSGNSDVVKAPVSAGAEDAVAVGGYANICAWVKEQIEMYGVDKAQARWRVICDLHETEDWWPSVVRLVKPILVEAIKIRNRQQAELASRQQMPIAQFINNPAATSSIGVGKADQVVASNLGNVYHSQYQ